VIFQEFERYFKKLICTVIMAEERDMKREGKPGWVIG
jgi:hypothetical protein